MLKTLKRNDISSYIVLLVWAFLFRVYTFTHLNKIELSSLDLSGSFASISFLNHFYQSSPFLFVLMSFIIQIVFAIYLNFQVNRQKFNAKKDVLTAFLYLLLTSFFPSLSVMSVPFLVSIFLMISFWIIINYNHAKQDSVQSFNIGILIGLATFLYAPSILFLFLFLFLLYQVHTYELKDFVAKLLGFFTPFVLYFSFAYLNDSLDPILSKINLNIHFPISIGHKISSVVYLLSMGVLLAFSLILYYMNLSKYSTISKKKIQMIFLFLMLSVFISLFHKEMPNPAFLIIIPSFSILLRQTFHVGKEKMNNFTFWTLILFLISFQWFIIR